MALVPQVVDAVSPIRLSPRAVQRPLPAGRDERRRHPKLAGPVAADGPLRDGDILPKNSLLTFGSNTLSTRVPANALWWCVDCTMEAASISSSSSLTAPARCCRLG